MRERGGRKNKVIERGGGRTSKVIEREREKGKETAWRRYEGERE